MAYQVTCECGKPHPVGAGDAGSSLKCGCGRTVEVPALHELRSGAGESLSPLDHLRGLLLTGQLPGTRECARCRRQTNGRMHVAIVCERVPGDGGTSQAEVLGCLLVPLLGWFMALMIFVGLRSRRRQFGDEVSVLVPLPLCDECRGDVTDATLPMALRQIPAYADLLDHYPNAQATRRG